ncbi:hypothetical protein N1851_018675 [Merluccius polli]|uniref:Uncharacterized protein n=1 Tax=Merluccius polli TaxID=89951 RepID=A0AA47MNA9_MERPO|nr:hypothetical protein N1851_018675 [Merluccius polli]
MVNTTDSGKGTSSDASTLQNRWDDCFTPLASEIFRFSSTPTSPWDLTESSEELMVEDVPISADIHSTTSTPTASSEIAIESVEV